MCSSSTNSAFGNNFIDSRVFNNHQDAIGQQPKVSKVIICFIITIEKYNFLF